MAVGDDDGTEFFISGLDINSNDFLPVGTTIPAEDLAWADSCLTKDPKELDRGWNFLKETLPETLSSPHVEDKIFDGHEIKILPSSNETRGDSYKLVNTDTDHTINGEGDLGSNHQYELTDRKTDVFWSLYKMEDDFLASIHPSSNRMTGDSYNLVSLDFSSNEEGDSRSNDEKTDDFWSWYNMEADFLASIRTSSNGTTGDSYNLVSSDITNNEEGDSRSNDEKTDDFWSRYKMEDDFLASIRPSSNGTTDYSYNLVSSDITNNEEGDSRSNDDFWSRYKMEDVFLPTYDESLRDLGNFHSGNIDLAVPDPPVDQSTDDEVFKVWDLDIPLEEDELTKRLNKALAESSQEPTTLASNQSRMVEGPRIESLDDLVSGMADLSLSF